MTVRFIDIHLLQTVPFANMNRDDLGSPKTLTFGGATRTRVSSQCWKRATREHMEAALADSPGYDAALRTREPVVLLRDRLVQSGWDAQEASHASRVIFGPFLAAEKSSSDGDDHEAAASVLLFLTESQFADLADLADTRRAEIATVDPRKKDPAPFKTVRKDIEAIIKTPRGLIALLGRMIAELPAANVDSAVQVAHAFTVHENAAEMDYFTAVDDYTRDAETGAGHLGTAEFAAGTFYRYATIDLATLTDNVGDPALADALAAQFLTSFAQSLPSGKSTATAPNARPDLIVIQTREDAPLSWSTAFEAPVTAANGYLRPAVDALARHAARVRDAYQDTPTWVGHLIAVDTDTDTSVFGEAAAGGVNGLVSAAMAAARSPMSQVAS